MAKASGSNIKHASPDFDDKNEESPDLDLHSDAKVFDAKAPESAEFPPFHRFADAARILVPREYRCQEGEHTVDWIRPSVIAYNPKPAY